MTTVRDFQAFGIGDDIYLSIPHEGGPDYYGCQLTIDEASALRDVLDAAIERAVAPTTTERTAA